jgi:hypothetical protein
MVPTDDVNVVMHSIIPNNEFDSRQALIETYRQHTNWGFGPPVSFEQ